MELISNRSKAPFRLANKGNTLIVLILTFFAAISLLRVQAQSCFGLTGAQACSGKGTCMSTDFCVCQSGYSGLECETTTCFGVNSTSVSVCSNGQGNCTSPDTCSCNQGFEGEQCQNIICFGLISNHDKVCSGNGRCVAPNTCQCNYGYRGEQCDTTHCSQVNDCSGNGICVGPGQCQCNDGFSGKSCEFSSNHTEASYCSANSLLLYFSFDNENQTLTDIGWTQEVVSGRLADLDNATISAQSGTCNEAAIFELPNAQITYTTSLILSTPFTIEFKFLLNKTTSTNDQVLLWLFSSEPSIVVRSTSTHFLVEVWNGGKAHKIEYPYSLRDGRLHHLTIRRLSSVIFESVLDGSNSQNISVDGVGSSFGSASNIIYFGSDKNDYKHMHGLMDELRIWGCIDEVDYTCKSCPTCNNRGRCVANNLCLCDSGFGGRQCEALQCFDTISTDPLSCSGHGFCNRTNICTCNSGYLGEQCQIPVCFGKNATEPSVCSSHGSCVSPNNCSCNAGYGNTMCQEFTCGGKPSSDPSVCSGNGTCSGPNTCSCFSGYGGSLCSGITCANLDPSSPNVCSGRGTCVGPNTCSCSDGYVGSNCQNVGCGGLNQTDPLVCSGRGTCSGPNVCECNSGFTGGNCQNPICFGRPSIDGQVCSGHGRCLSPNTCQCFEGYTGNNCSTKVDDRTFCFGRVDSDPDVCSGNGQCTATDTCTCSPAYTGRVCQFPLCAGRSAESVDVCSGVGACVSPNQCQCLPGYQGANCEQFSCFGVLSTLPTVCSGRGTCNSPDTCVCQGGYSGNCSTPICFGFSSSSPDVCSGAGICQSPNNCVCKQGRIGSTCQSSVCFDKIDTDTSVCSGNGICTDTDHCSCKEGFTGRECEIPICFGKNSTDPSVCSGHGSCEGKDMCTCFESDTTGFFFGQNCERCRPDYEPEGQCNSRRCDPAITCNGRGVCNANFECSCSGNFGGSFCEGCREGFYGPSCNITCSPSANCNNRGVCGSMGQCLCFNNNTHGFFNGSTCSECQNNFYGVNCNVFVSDFRFSNGMDKIEGELVLPGSSNPMPCSELFNQHQFFGTEPICWWPSERNAQLPVRRHFEIVLGRESFIDQTPSITLRNPTVSIPIREPLNPVTPVAILNAPTTLGSCDSLTLDGSQSHHSGRRPLRFIWEAKKGFQFERINEVIQLIREPFVSIDKNLMEPGNDYEFQLIVQTNFGQATINSPPVTITVRKQSSPLPIVSIRGPRVQQTFISDFFQLTALTQINEECFYSNRQITFSWRQVSGPRVHPVSQGRFLSFQANTFPPLPATYIFEVTATPVANPSVSVRETVEVRTLLLPLVARIRGGSRSVSSGTELRLDASPSFDPNAANNTEIFIWSCTNANNGGFCPQSLRNLQTGRIITVTPTQGTFVFTVVYAKGGRSDQASVTVHALASAPPSVSIEPLNRKTNRDVRLTLSANVHSQVGSIPIAMQWKLFEGSNPQTAIDVSHRLQDWVVTPVNTPFLVFRENTLTAGQVYRFRLEATQGGNTGFSEITTQINEPPRPGTVTASPSSGTALDTVFTITCSQFSDDDLPLSYTFSYQDSNGQVTFLTQNSFSNILRVSLPSPISGDRLRIIATVTDSLGASTTANELIVTVQPKVFDSPEKLIDFGEELSRNLEFEDDPETLSQLTTVMASVINPHIRNNSVTRCPNDCNGNGACDPVTSLCTCFQGFGDADCSVTEEEGRRKRRIREQFLNSVLVAGSRRTGQSISPSFISQQTSSLAQMTSGQVSQNMQFATLNYLSTLVSPVGIQGGNSQSGATRLPMLTLQSVLRLLSSLSRLSSVQDSRRSLLSTGNAFSQQYYGSLLNSTRDLLRTATLPLVPNEEPARIFNNDMKLFGQRITGQSLNGKLISFSESALSDVTLPQSLYEQLQLTNPQLEIVEIAAIEMGTNPYQYSSSSLNISSAVFSLRLITNNYQDELRVYNLSEPIRMQIAGRYPVAELSSDCSKPGLIAQCRYWSENRTEWVADDTCSLVTVTANYAICNCTHLTDFAVFIPYFIPDESLNIPANRSIIFLENEMSFWTTSLSGVGILGYVVSFIIASIVDRFITKSRSEQKEDEQLLDIGLFRKCVEHILKYHVWISLCVLPVTERRNFSRAQRVTVVWTIIFLTMAFNAMFFTTSYPLLITAAIASNVFTWPFVFIITSLFRYTKSEEIVPETMAKKVPVESLYNTNFEMEDIAHMEVPAVPDDLKKTFPEKSHASTTPSNLLDTSAATAKNDSDGEKALTTATKSIKAAASKLFKTSEPAPIKASDDAAFQNDDFENDDFGNMGDIPDVLPGEEDVQEQNDGSNDDVDDVDDDDDDDDDENEEENNNEEKDQENAEGNKKTEPESAPVSVPSIPSAEEPKNEIEKRKSMRLSARKSLKLQLDAVEQETGQKATTMRADMKISEALDRGDDIFDNAQKILGDSAQLGLSIVATILFTICYFTFFALCALIFHLDFVSWWQPYFTTLLLCASLIGYVIMLEYIYFRMKYFVWKREMKWDINKLHLVGSIVIMVFILLGILVTAVIASSLQFWNSPHAIGHVAVVLGSLVCLLVCVLVYLVLLMKRPDPITALDWQNPISNKPSPFIESYMIYFYYPIIWMLFAGCVAITILFGIYMPGDRVLLWFFAAMISLIIDIAITKTANIIVQSLFMNAFYKVFDFAMSTREKTETKQNEKDTDQNDQGVTAP